jgi:signal transduction histidine kinase
MTEFILVVDDNPTNLSVLTQALKSAGFKVRVAVDGESAIEQVQYDQPALILLDVEMPGIDGFETCIKLKSNPSTYDIPIIFMTALADKESKLKGLSLGAVDYITKPFEQEEVLARVKVHLKLRSLTKTLEEKNAQLYQLNEGLEQRVAERTAELQKAQIQMIQQEKLSSLGELVAGVAHEINNPISFISSNIEPAKQYVAALTKILQLYQKNYSQPVPEIENESDEVDLEFLLEDLPKILDSMKLGSERIQNISNSLRNFSRSDITTKIPVNLHEGIDSTLLILRHRMKACGNQPEIKVIKHYGNLPLVTCYPGQMNQVFMNIFANAIDALEDGNGSWHSQADPGNEGNGKEITLDQLPITNHQLPTLKICTELSDGNNVIIRIADNGSGMTEEVKQRIFEPMFTTKTLGKGTGLGLSICRQIIAEKHGGKLSCISAPGEGTEFVIEIPLG